MRVLHGEANPILATQETWDQIAVLKVELSNYNPKDIFNMDDMHFFKMAPNKALWNHVVSGQKKIKNCITIGLCANMDGFLKVPLLIINKHRNPCPLSRRKIEPPNNMGIWWYSYKKAWMIALLFQDWIYQV